MMSYRSLLIAGVVAGALLGSFPALAAEWKPFSQAALAEAQKEGKPILVDIYALVQSILKESTFSLGCSLIG
ncbi:MAG: hypothetical protein WBE08_06790 [Methyloceanibacter sp.]|jgi:hypothetical protein